MRVVLILSLASVLLVSVTLAAPSWVEQPAYDPEDINKRGMEIFESFMDWKRSLPADSDQSFLAFQRSLQQREQLSADIEGGPETPLTEENQQRGSLVEEEQVEEPDLAKIARASKISPDNVKERYQQWLKKLPKGRNSSFKAFLDWLDDQDDRYDDHDDHDDRYDRYDRDDRDHDDRYDHDDDDDRYDHDEPDDADDFGLTNDEFEELYRIWLSKNSAGEDLSYRAFVRWMQKNNGPEFDEDGTRRRITYIRWGSKIGEYYKDRYARENDVNNERQLAEVQKFPSEEQQPAINQREEEAAGYEYGGLVGENVNRGLQEPIAAAYDGQNAVGYEFQRDMERRQGEEREGFAPARFARAEPQEGLSPAPVEEAKPQEEQTPLPFVETEPNDTNGGYSCETNNPCNIENIVNTQFYFATTSTDKYIQCDAWGGCHTLTCDDGLAWDDTIKMCGLRT